MTPRTRNIVLVLGWLLLAIAVMRIGAVALHDPVAGYANQYDMVRSSACLGVWPDVPVDERALASLEAPIENWTRGERIAASCYPSTDVALGAVAFGLGDLLGFDDGGRFDLRVLGGFKALLLGVLLIVVQHRYRTHPGAALVHGALAAMVLADPANTLYLNTLYTESGALAGAWLAVAAIAGVALDRARVGGWGALFLLGLVLLAGSRVQHLLLPIGLVLLWWLLPIARDRSGRLVGTAAVPIALLGIALAWHNQGRFDAIEQANRWNSFFGAIAPASADPARLLARLDLPIASCEPLVHSTWYLRRGRDAMVECPAAFALGHLAIAGALLREPATLVTVFARGAARATTFRLPYLGELAGADRGRLGPGPLGLTASVGDPLERAPFPAVVVLIAAPLLLGVGAGVRLIRGAFTGAERRAGAVAVDAALAALAGMTATTWASSVLGDGFSELARHLHLAHNTTFAAWLIVPVLLATREPRARVADALVLLAVALIALASRPLPTATGVLDNPAGDRVATSQVAISGWVLAPGGITTIEAAIEGRAPLALTVMPAPEVARMFPVNRGGAAFSFHGEIALVPSRDLTRGPAALAIRVRAPDGSVSVIDRRWLTIETR